MSSTKWWLWARTRLRAMLSRLSSFNRRGKDGSLRQHCPIRTVKSAWCSNVLDRFLDHQGSTDEALGTPARGAFRYLESGAMQESERWPCATGPDRTGSNDQWCDVSGHHYLQESRRDVSRYP